MKIGMIFECGPNGADQQVCEYLAHRLLPDIEVVSITLDDKPKLLRDCGPAAATLLRQGCERITIVWDLHPPWRKKKEPPCRKEDRETIHTSLSHSRVPIQQVALVCIKEELEAWLLADGRALSTVLSRPAHPVRVRDVKKPDRTQKPKTRLNKIFQQYSGRPYVDLMYARKIVEALPDLTRIRRSTTFVRFAVKLTGREP